MNWHDIPEATMRYFKTASSAVSRYRQVVADAPDIRHHVLLNADTGELYVGIDKQAADQELAAWHDVFEQSFPKFHLAPIDVPPPQYGRQPWVWIKQAVDPVLSTTAKLLNYQPSALNAVIGGPSPLAAALTSGLVGAGLGYAGGRVAESIFPQHLESGVLSRNAALLGGLIGAAPAVAWGMTAHRHHPDRPGWRAWLSSWPFRRQDMAEPIKKACGILREKVAFLDPIPLIPFGRQAPPPYPQGLGQGLDQLATMPNINRDQFGQVVWQDPNTPMPIRAATVGLVNTASMANGNKPFVSPWDIASVAAGGAAKGFIVGKALGALAGLTPESQQTAQRIGLWGGLLTAVVPNAFPNASNQFGY